MKAEDILREVFNKNKFADFPYNDRYVATIEAMEKYGEEVLKIAAEKAKLTTYQKGNHMDFSRKMVDKESILNCLKK